MSYIGSAATPLPVAFSGVRTQSFNGTGSQTAFTLSRAVSAATDIEVVVNNVQQSPYDSSYNISGATLTFSEAPSSGTNNIYVIFRDQPVGSLTDPTAVRLTGDQTITGTKTFSGTVVIGRVDSSSEGGQLDLCRSTDNAPAWGIDVNGNTSTPSLRFVDNIAAASRMQIDGGGRVTMPYQPAFYAWSPSGGYTTANTTLTTWASVECNRGSHFNASTGIFTAPVAGAYEFVFHMTSPDPARYITWLYFFKNGSAFGNTSIHTDNPSNSGGSDNNWSVINMLITNLAANDQISVRFGNNATASGWNPQIYFSGKLLG